MKKTLFIMAVFVAGTIIFSSKNTDVSNEFFIDKTPAAKTLKQQTVIQPVLTEEIKETASLETLEESYEDLGIKDLQVALERVDKSREKLQLIEAFNSRKLSEAESQELATIIRTRVVLTKLVMEKKFEELESL